MTQSSPKNISTFNYSLKLHEHIFRNEYFISCRCHWNNKKINKTAALVNVIKPIMVMYEVFESCVTSFFLIYLACFQCSASCGDGIQRRQVSCRAGDRRTSPESGCSARSRPPSSRSCRLADCPSRYRWREGDWQAVSRGSPGSSESFLDKERRRGGGVLTRSPLPPLWLRVAEDGFGSVISDEAWVAAPVWGQRGGEEPLLSGPWWRSDDQAVSQFTFLETFFFLKCTLEIKEFPV